MLSLTLAGCVLAPAGDDPAGAENGAALEAMVEDQAPAPADAGLPDVQLTGELLYQVLVGEMAANRGDVETAAPALIEAARQSQDPRLAERATRVALSANDYELALEGALLWSELRPGLAQPRETLALIMVEQGRLNEAEEQFAGLLDRDGNARDQYFRRIARLLGQRTNTDNAQALMAKLVGRYDDDPDAHFAAAFLADRAKDSDTVLSQLDRALALRPGWEEAALAKLGHLIQNQYPRERIDTFARDFLDGSPRSNRVRVSYARYLLDQEAISEALDEFRAVLKSDPEDTTSLMAAGLLSVQEEDYKSARRYFTRHLDVTPGNDQVRLYLGQVAEERGRYDEARQWYEEITDRAHRFDARLRLASVLRETEGLEASMTHLESVQSDDEPQFVRLALTKEMILREAEELERAKSVLDDAVARYPGNTDLVYARGLLAARLDRIGEHEQDMRMLLAEDPNNAHALNALGYTLADATDRTQEAHELIKKALSMRPDDPFILDSMGWVQYRMGNHQEAIQYLERALSLRDDAEIAAHLGEVLWTIGDKARAREVWERAKRDYPENHVLNETLQRFTQ